MSLECEARALYDACPTSKPTWDQLGDVTKGVWRDYAARKLAGVADWWSIRHNNPATLIKAVSAPGIRGALQECLNMTLNHKKVAEQLDAISEAFMALAGTFRSGGGSADGGSVDGAAEKPVRGGKSKPKPAAAKEEAASEMSIDDVRTKLKELVEAKGKDKMVEALESVGAGKLGDVDESQYQELLDKAQEFIDEEDEPAPKKAAPKGKKKGPSLDDVNEAAKALIAADKPAYLKLAKKLGKPSEMEEDDYAAAIAAYEQAMPEGSEDGDDDLL